MGKCPICGNEIKEEICEECGYDSEHDYKLHQLSHLLSVKEVEKYQAKINHLKIIYQQNISKQTNNIAIKDVNELFELASSYHYGSVNIKKDYQKAIAYYQEAVKLNHAGAMYNLAYMYNNGIGVKQDKLKAQILFDKAVELHKLNDQQKPNSRTVKNATELYELAYNYHHGRNGVQKDLQKAAQYYEEAANLNHVAAMDNLVYMYNYGVGVQKNLQKANQLAIKAKEIRTENKNQQKTKQLTTVKTADELYELACNYHYGNNGVNQDYQKAFEYYQEAIKLNHTGAMYNLGYMYNYGIGVNKDLNKAKQLFIAAKKIRTKK